MVNYRLISLALTLHGITFFLNLVKDIEDLVGSFNYLPHHIAFMGHPHLTK